MTDETRKSLERCKPDELASQLTEWTTFKIVRIGRIIDRITCRLARLEGLNPNDFKLLVLVARLGEGTITAAIKHTTIDQGNTSKSVKRLLEQGMIRRRENPDSRRQVLLSVTDEGLDVVRRALPYRLEVERDMRNHFTAEDWKELDDRLAAILKLVGSPHFIEEIEYVYERDF